MDEEWNESNVKSMAISGPERQTVDDSVPQGMVQYAMPCGGCLKSVHRRSGGTNVKIFILGEDGKTVRLTSLNVLLPYPGSG